MPNLGEDTAKYAGDQEWDYYRDAHFRALDRHIRGSGFTQEEIRATASWPTLGTYLQGKLENFTPHQRFLKRFTHLSWRQYSALVHCGYEGYIGELTPGAYLVSDMLPREMRPELDERYNLDFLTRHLGRAALVLLCISTELQAYFKFPDANINERVCKMWDALKDHFETKELYRDHYAALLKEKRISL